MDKQMNYIDDQLYEIGKEEFVSRRHEKRTRLRSLVVTVWRS